MIPCPERAPIFENLRQAAFGQMGLHHIRRYKCQTKTVQRGIEDLPDGRENELTFHPHFHLAAALFELPCIQTSIGRKA